MYQPTLEQRVSTSTLDLYCTDPYQCLGYQPTLVQRVLTSPLDLYCNDPYQCLVYQPTLVQRVLTSPLDLYCTDPYQCCLYWYCWTRWTCIREVFYANFKHGGYNKILGSCRVQIWCMYGTVKIQFVTSRSLVCQWERPAWSYSLQSVIILFLFWVFISHYLSFAKLFFFLKVYSWWNSPAK